MKATTSVYPTSPSSVGALSPSRGSAAPRAAEASSSAGAGPSTALAPAIGYPVATVGPTAQRAARTDKLGPEELKVWQPSNDEGRTQGLMALGLPLGISRALQHDRTIVAHFGVFDNSKSMDWGEGQRASVGPWGGTWEKCKAFQEQATEFGPAMEIRALLEPPSWTVPLNPIREEKPSARSGGTQLFDNKSDDQRAIVRRALEAPPSGVTPLTERVRDIHAFITENRKNGVLPKEGTVLLEIFTDGEPSDEQGDATHEAKRDFEDALLKLGREHNIALVFRLCTNKQHVVDYYNKTVDPRVNEMMTVEVLDDNKGEQAELKSKGNGFVTHSWEIGRLRASLPHTILDHLDERSLELHEIKEVIALIYGLDAGKLPPLAPETWQSFKGIIQEVQAQHAQVMHPETGRPTHLIDLDLLHARVMRLTRAGQFAIASAPPPQKADQGCACTIM